MIDNIDIRVFGCEKWQSYTLIRANSTWRSRADQRIQAETTWITGMNIAGEQIAAIRLPATSTINFS